MEGILEMVQGLLGNLTGGTGDIMDFVNRMIEMVVNFALGIWGPISAA